MRQVEAGQPRADGLSRMTEPGTVTLAEHGWITLPHLMDVVGLWQTILLCGFDAEHRTAASAVVDKLIDIANEDDVHRDVMLAALLLMAKAIFEDIQNGPDPFEDDPDGHRAHSP